MNHGKEFERLQAESCSGCVGTPTPAPSVTPTPLVLPGVTVPNPDPLDTEEDDEVDFDMSAAVKELVDGSGDAKDLPGNTNVSDTADIEDATLADIEGPPACPEDFACVNGNCVNGTCFCQKGWAGMGCNLAPAPRPTPNPTFVYNRMTGDYWKSIKEEEAAQFAPVN